MNAIYSMVPLILLLAAACSGGGTAASASGGGGGGGSPEPPKFLGFTLPVQEGAYFEYRWSTEAVSWDSRGHRTTRGAGRYRMVMGAKRRIGDIDFFTTQVEGHGAPGWRYLAFMEHRILGSADGVAVVVLFDGNRGSWAGSGFLGAMDPNTLVIAHAGAITDNPHRSGDGVRVVRSLNRSQCELINGVRICGNANSEYVLQEEHWQPGIGPAAYHSRRSVSTQYGGASNETWVGLSEYSMTPPSAPLAQLELEPNDNPATAVPFDPARPLAGLIKGGDPGYVPENSPGIQSLALRYLINIGQFLMQDWYGVTLDAAHAGGTLELSFPAGVDLDLYVFDPSGVHLLAYAIGDVRSNPERVTLPGPGEYRIAVWGGGAATDTDYTLRVLPR